MITITGVDEVIKKLTGYITKLNENTKRTMERLAQIGIDEATVRFKDAIYDGTNDVTVDQSPHWEGENVLYLYARGQTVCFIEFGTGVMFVGGEHTHPNDPTNSMRGTYGQGKGKRNAWVYYGEEGSHGLTLTTKSGKRREGVILTHGNPANRAMYEAGKAMREKILEIAKEEFGYGRH